ncbi:alpha-ketoacid dehydrogenase subunit beta [Chloroflexota bacterium]
MRKITYLKAINEAVHEEMARDPTVFLMGEDVRVWGSAYREFKGLFDKYGAERVLDTPVSETAILGGAIGAAATGLRPIANIMYLNFIGVATDELLNQLQWPYMGGGQARLPLTIMSYSGAGFCAGATHSSCREGWLLSIPGLKIAVPSTPYDAKGLVKSAIRDDNPVIVLEHQWLLLSSLAGEVPEQEYTIPLGKADIKREGKDVTVVATSLMLHRVLAAAAKLHEQGISVEVVDPRTWVPLDKQTIIESVKKTGKLVIMTEECITGSAAGETAAIVADEAFDYLNAPIKRVCAPDTPIPFGPILENFWMPNEENLIEVITKIV